MSAAFKRIVQMWTLFFFSYLPPKKGLIAFIFAFSLCSCYLEFFILNNV